MMCAEFPPPKAVKKKRGGEKKHEFDGVGGASLDTSKVLV